MYSLSMLTLDIEVEYSNLCSLCSLLHKKVVVPGLVAYFVEPMFHPVSLTATGACVCFCYLGSLSFKVSYVPLFVFDMLLVGI